MLINLAKWCAAGVRKLAYPNRSVSARFLLFTDTDKLVTSLKRVLCFYGIPIVTPWLYEITSSVECETNIMVHCNRTDTIEKFL